MKLGVIALKIRTGTTRFGNRVLGVAEFALAAKATFRGDVAFVIPLREVVSNNNLDSGLNQKITSHFGVVAVLVNDSNRKDKTGLTAYDLIEDVRTELFGSILAWQISTAETVISYVGSRILEINPAYIWYQYEFQYMTRIDEDDGIDVGVSALGDFNTLYQQYMLAPDSILPLPAGLPTALAPVNLDLVFTNEHEFDDSFSNDFANLAGILNR